MRRAPHRGPLVSLQDIAPTGKVLASRLDWGCAVRPRAVRYSLLSASGKAEWRAGVARPCACLCPTIAP